MPFALSMKGIFVMKKIINNPENVVAEMLEGVVAANPSLALVPEKRIVYRKNIDKEKVMIVTGSGSGHEPDQFAFVGKGMLDAVAAGPVFAAPTADAIYEAAKLVDQKKGILFLIKNYTGDRAQFSMASEMCEMDGIKTATVVADDDVAVKDSTFTAGRRGICGAIFNYKITCAKADMGASLEELVELAKKVNSQTRSMGYSLSSCTPPAKGAPIFEIGEDEIELGVGIHGEPGRKRIKWAPADEMITDITNSIIEDLPYSSGDEVALMVNGLGGTPMMELYIAYRKAAQILSERGIKVYRSYVGNYCTSLDMQGCSVSLLKLDDEMKELLGYPIDIPLRYF